MSWYFLGALSRQRCTTQHPWRFIEICAVSPFHALFYLHAALHDLFVHVHLVLLELVAQTALDHVVAVGVRAERRDVASQRVHDVLQHVGLVLAHLDQLLHGARAVHIERGVDDLVLHLPELETSLDTNGSYHFAPLLDAAHVQQFLEEVVSE